MLPPHLQQGAEAMLLRGQALIAEARKLKEDSSRAENANRRCEKYQEAIKDLRLAQSSDTAAGQITRDAVYLIGICFLETRRSASRGQPVRPRLSTVCGNARGRRRRVAKGRTGAATGHHDQAMVYYHQMVDAIGNVETYVNPWLRLDELRARLMRAYQQYLDTQNYGLCLELVRLVRPCSPANGPWS